MSPIHVCELYMLVNVASSATKYGFNQKYILITAGKDKNKTISAQTIVPYTGTNATSDNNKTYLLIKNNL